LTAPSRPPSDSCILTKRAGAPMAGHIKGHMVDLEASDITACQYLAAAVALEWNNLPKELQNAILQQASALEDCQPQLE
jgi:hypothetical protein